MKIRFSLYTKMLAGYVLFALFCVIFVNFYSAKMIDRLLVQQKANELYKQAQGLASYYKENAEAAEPEQLTAVLERFQAYSSADSTHIWLVNADGMIILDSAWQDVPEETVSSQFNAADFTKSYYIYGNYLPGEFSITNEQCLTVYTSLTSQYKVSGYIVITLPCSQIHAQGYYMQGIVYMTVMVVIALSLIVLVIFSFVVYTPLKRITRAADEYAAGNFQFRPNVGSHDEMGYLAATLGFMANEIEEAGEGQRKLVANISHDFRSPLTSIKGYLEAILDGTIPPEMQEKYLHIVLDETARLNNLSQSLLTLNTVNEKGTYLDCTEFDVNHMIRKVSASFEGICQKRSLRFELIFSDISLFVLADREKIQQVLYNLVDNAIKFSSDGGIICIETFARHDKAFISVKDNGIGIPKEDIGKIWNRFYKSDLSRGKDKKGTGLGLAIARDIIQSHHESIDVVSTPDVGTKFTFRLPLAKRS